MPYYRLQPAGRPLPALIGDHHTSQLWVGEADKPCPECSGCGTVAISWDRDGECPECGGDGRVDDVRRGVSCCRSLEDLVAYFGSRSAEYAGCAVVALEGELSDDEDFDADAPGRPVLVHPTEAWVVVELDSFEELEALAEE